jgi:acetylornithine deacetylase
VTGASPLERELVEEIAGLEGEIVALATQLIGFDTTARDVGDPARDEAALQSSLAERLAAHGFEIDLFEPDAAALQGRPLVPPGLDFAGRPQLVARLAGTGAGRSLLLNGHIDVVPAHPGDGWTSPPFAAEVRDGLLYGRGACDMKGGIAAMVVAAEALARRGVLAGDLVVATNTDEESSGAGGMALVDRGVRADGGIVTEPTGFDVWVACRGSTYATVTVPGRAGHAEISHPGWREGGAVNAIEKSEVVLAALRSVRARWAADTRLRHPVLSVPDALPTMVSAGDWAVTIPGQARLTIAVTYLGGQADAAGWASHVEDEVSAAIAEACAADDWLAEHPVTVAWWPNAVMPMEIDPEAPIVTATTDALRVLGVEPRLGGLDSWYDGATFTLLAETPAVGFGPSGLGRGAASVAHAVDEHVPVEDLVRCAQAIAVAALRFCGTAA